jgi:hypothetical protein
VSNFLKQVFFDPCVVEYPHLWVGLKNWENGSKSGVAEVC